MNPNIKGQNNGRQIITACVTGLVAGVMTTLGIFATRPEMLHEALPPVLASCGLMAIISALNWLRGKPINEIAEDIVDGVLGEETGEDERPRAIR